MRPPVVVQRITPRKREGESGAAASFLLSKQLGEQTNDGQPNNPSNPKSHSLFSAVSGSKLGTSSLLKGHNAASDKEIKQILAVAHNVSLFVASTYGLAHSLASENRSFAARNTVGMLRHSLGNDLDNALGNSELLAPVVEVARLNLRAAEELFDSSGQVKTRTLDDKLKLLIERFIFRNCQPPSISFEKVHDCKADIRFAAMIVELCRNLAKHSHGGGMQVLNSASEPAIASVRIKAPAVSEKDIEDIQKRLDKHNPYRKNANLRGLDYIMWLAHQIGTPKSCVLIEFKDEAGGVYARSVGSWKPGKFEFQQTRADKIPPSTTMSLSIEHLQAIHEL